MKLMQMADSIRFRTMTTEELRKTFLLSDLFKPGQIDLTYVDLDRAVIGSAVPLDKPLVLPTDPDLKATYFTERRELGALNIGGPGAVTVDGVRYDLDNLDTMYIGRGSKDISFASKSKDHPAEYYLLSYPAHATHTTQRIKAADAMHVKMGSSETANERQINRVIHLAGARSCQLVMGFTQLAIGSVWNTMPAHTHNRRSEIYLYFNIPATDRVIHLMGPANETRDIIIANKQVVVSPGWSIHAGVGTTNYTFCWGMGGENQDYGDMDQVAITDLQ
jgi:4-deoxy-L-threo-5-hexosulose-uronate ketol-isomerase